MQLTGLSDAVYAEAEVITHQYDVVLDVTVINRTAATMQSLCLELATMGDLKLVERPQNYTLAAGESKRLRANIKVRARSHAPPSLVTQPRASLEADRCRLPSVTAQRSARGVADTCTCMHPGDCKCLWLFACILGACGCLSTSVGRAGVSAVTTQPAAITELPIDNCGEHAQVSSTETGVIFGSIVYETGGTAESHVVVLNDIHIDIMDYISPAPCADVAFRNFWAEFEWENKVRGVRHVP